MKRFIIVVLAGTWALLTQPGCGGAGPGPAAKPDSLEPTVGEVLGISAKADSVTPLADDTAATDAVNASQPQAEQPQPAGGNLKPAVEKPKEPPKENSPPEVEQPAQVPEKPKPLPRMWDYGADNCLPCIQMEPILDQLAEEYEGRIDIRVINVYQQGDLARMARIQVIPTQVFIDSDGKELFRHVGFYPRDSIVAKFREFSFE